MAINRPKTFENSVTLKESDDETHNDNKGPQSQQAAQPQTQLTPKLEEQIPQESKDKYPKQGNIKEGVDFKEEMMKRQENTLLIQKNTKKEQLQALRLNRENEESEQKIYRDFVELKLKRLPVDVFKELDLGRLFENSSEDDVRYVNSKGTEEDKTIRYIFINRGLNGLDDNKDMIFMWILYYHLKKIMKASLVSVETTGDFTEYVSNGAKRKGEPLQSDKKKISKKSKEVFFLQYSKLVNGEKHESILKRVETFLKHNFQRLPNAIVKSQLALMAGIYATMNYIHDDDFIEKLFPIYYYGSKPCTIVFLKQFLNEMDISSNTLRGIYRDRGYSSEVMYPLLHKFLGYIEPNFQKKYDAIIREIKVTSKSPK
jgi:hypothetical protein